jgi:hypothetical protein
VQGALGDLNDIAVNEKLSEQLVDGEDPAAKRRGGRTKKAFAVGRLSAHEKARIAPVLNDAERAYAAFANSKPFWCDPWRMCTGCERSPLSTLRFAVKAQRNPWQG